MAPMPLFLSGMPSSTSNSDAILALGMVDSPNSTRANPEKMGVGSDEVILQINGWVPREAKADQAAELAALLCAQK